MWYGATYVNAGVVGAQLTVQFNGQPNCTKKALTAQSITAANEAWAIYRKKEPLNARVRLAE